MLSGSGGGKSGGSNIYQSPQMAPLDQIGSELLLSTITGQPIQQSPAISSQYVAQSTGGRYNPDTQTIQYPDGAVLSYDPASQSFSDAGANIGAGGGGKGGENASPKATAANKILTEQVQPNIYGPNSAYNMFGSDTFGGKVYDPTSGNEVDQAQKPQQLTGDYYLNKYGDYLNKGYTPVNYDAQSYNPYQYQQFDYKSPDINTVNNVDQQLVQKQIAQGQDEVNQSAIAQRKNLEGFIANSGGSLSGGRAARLQNDLDVNTSRQNAVVADKLNSDQALRAFYDASHVRDLQVAQNMDVQKLRGGESRQGQDVAQSESKYAQDVGRQEKQKAFDVASEQNRYGFEAGQNQGARKLEIASSADTNQANRAFQESQANRQQQLQKIQALQDFLRIYSQQNATAGQLNAQASHDVGDTLMGLGKIGATVGAAYA